MSVHVVVMRRRRVRRLPTRIWPGGITTIRARPRAGARVPAREAMVPAGVSVVGIARVAPGPDARIYEDATMVARSLARERVAVAAGTQPRIAVGTPIARRRVGRGRITVGGHWQTTASVGPGIWQIARNRRRIAVVSVGTVGGRRHRVIAGVAAERGAATVHVGRACAWTVAAGNRRSRSVPGNGDTRVGPLCRRARVVWRQRDARVASLHHAAVIAGHRRSRRVNRRWGEGWNSLHRPAR
jgi:hypothetical protein